MRRDEYMLQCQVVRWLELKYPDVLFNGSPGGVRYGSGREAVIRGMLAKRAGATKGWPDLMIYKPAWEDATGNIKTKIQFCGFAIEFKSATGTVTSDQKEILARLTRAGWKTVVCRTFEDAEKKIGNYLSVPAKSGE